MPKVTLALAEAVTRLGHLRRQLKDLETEEGMLRDQILAAVESWPREAFPLRVGAFEVRLGERKGRIDDDATWAMLESERLRSDVPEIPKVKDPERVEDLRRSLVRLDMPSETREVLVTQYKAAIVWDPTLSFELLTRFRDEARLTPDQYARCFKDGKPTVTTLTVR